MFGIVVTEIEFEHVSEVYVEQAFLDYELTDWMSLRGGLLLIPMGIINQYHEPPSFNGVERPLIDTRIAPTTWREIGAGIAGRISSLIVRYQLYLVNGFIGYYNGALLSGRDGLRKGCLKGAESVITSPNLTTRVDYYGIPSLNFGLSAYFGKTQSILYTGKTFRP